MNATLQQQFSNSKQSKGTRPPTILLVGHVAFQARPRVYKPLGVGVSEEQMHALLLLFPLSIVHGAAGGSFIGVFCLCHRD